MSEAKLAAARELIQEKEYAAARAVLRTTPEPKAREWLAKLEQIAPEAKQNSSEAEKYYKEENKARKGRQRNKALKRGDKGIEIMIGSIGLLALWIYVNYIEGEKYGGEIRFGGTPIEIIIPAACIAGVIIGVLIIRNSDREAKKVG